MSFEKIVKEYLKELQEEYLSAQRGGQQTAELSYRPMLDKFIRNLAKEMNAENECDVVLEPRNQGRAGRPDWRIHNKNTLGIYGYIEAKGITDEAFDVTPYHDQIARYRALGHKLIITDGIDFLFCKTESGSTPEMVSLIDKTKLRSKNWSDARVDLRFKVLAEDFFSTPSPRYCNENELIEQVALRTRWLSDDILKYAEINPDEVIDDDEKIAVDLLEGIRELVYNHNDRELRTPRIFADFTAQVIMFCLLYAHRVYCTEKDSALSKEKKIKKFIGDEFAEDDSLYPFRNLMLYIEEHATEDAFIWQKVDECIKFLSFVSMTEDQLTNPDYHSLFEDFLSRFDSKTRFDYGAFYTPKALAGFIVRATNEIAKEEFNGASIFDGGNTVIDPCCGTGSFLEELIIQDTKKERYNLCGFEVLPAPYMLANYRMALVNKQNKGKHITNIVLANSLSNSVLGEDIESKTIEGHEQKRASELSSKPIKLIIGNPPCSDKKQENKSLDFSIINELMEDFRAPREERHGRSNTERQRHNPHLQFIRWSCEKLLETPNHAVLSFVVPLTFLENESYKYARKYIVEHFSSIWVVEVDADARTGARSNGLFKTMQGRAIIIVTHAYQENEKAIRYHHMDISHMDLKSKMNMLGMSSTDIINAFQEHDIPIDSYSFIPARPFDIEFYSKCWPVSGEAGQTAVFKQHCSGIKLAPTAIFTHVKKPMLKRRSKEIAQKGEIAGNEWFMGQDRKPGRDKIIAFQNALNDCGGIETLDELMENSIKTYTFRPYMVSNVMLWEDLLRTYRAGGGGTRLRPEIVNAYKHSNTVGFAMAHAPKDLNPTLSQFVSFCWYYPDNDMCTRGNSHIYMNQYQTGRGGPMDINVNDKLLDSLKDKAGEDVSREELARKVVFYVYAVLCSQLYLDTFEGALFTVNQSDKRARVPIVSDYKLFERLSAQGEKLAELEKCDYKPDNILNYDYLAIKESIPRGFVLKKNEHPFDEETEELLLSDGNTIIRIPCPLDMQKLNISGYDVVKNVWLKFNSYEFTHCTFDAYDAERLLDYLNVLCLHKRMVDEIDELMYPVISGDKELIEV